MEAEKFRNLGDDELGLEERKTAEALFRLRFQMKLGQTEGVKKLRELRKDIARIHTVRRERELGIHEAPAGKSGEETAAETKAEAAAPAKHARKKAAKPVKKKAAKKAVRKATSRSRAARRPAAKASGSKKKAARSTSVKKG
jgi:large subunit ribosomal protein L29